MPRTQLQVPQSAPVRAVLPTKAYPHLRQVVEELDFACATCSSAFGQPVWVSFLDARKEPVRGPQHYTTSFVLLCPECNTVPMDGPFIENGMIDLLQVPKTYKRPRRSTAGRSESGLEMEAEGPEEVEAVDVPEKRQRTLKTKKKVTDLSPATRGRKAKGAVKAAAKKKAENDEFQV